MSEVDPRVVLVDPYSSGAMLAEELVARGIRCVAVESSGLFPADMKSRFRPELFAQVIVHEQNPAATLRRVAHHAPTHVMAGFESGVELAEWLSQQLGLPTHRAASGSLRRDKYLMAEAVRRHGLRIPRQGRADTLAEALELIESEVGWPAIVKPTKSVASDGVCLCHDEGEVRAAVEQILSCPNILGLPNDQVLVQEYLQGTEYALDFVVCDGQAKNTAIWQYHRPESSERFLCYDAMELLPYDGDRQQQLRGYAVQVLEALGFRFGPAHCEIMWAHGAPLLVEVGARLTAGKNAVLSRECGGICQLDETVQAIISPQSFRETLDLPVELRQYAVNAFLAPHRAGRLVRVHGLAELKELATVHSMSLATQPGTQLKRVAGMVTLMHEDRSALQRDLALIRELSRRGIFEVSTAESVEAARPASPHSARRSQYG